MTNSYYQNGGVPAPNSRAKSEEIRSEFASIESGFSKLPTLAGNPEKLVRVKGDASGLEAVPVGNLNFSWTQIVGRPTGLSAFSNDAGFVTATGSVAYATNSGNSSTTSQRIFDRVNTSGLNGGYYGSISINGQSGGWSGIRFDSENASLLFCGNAQGYTIGHHDDSLGWTWQIQNGALTVGSVPWSKLSSIPSPIYASPSRPGATRLYRSDYDTSEYIHSFYDSGYQRIAHVDAIGSPLRDVSVGFSDLSGKINFNGACNFVWSDDGLQKNYLLGTDAGGTVYPVWRNGVKVGLAGQADYATTAGSAPASDVHSWAKQSVKPSYTAAEVGALANNGVGDTLTLGNWFRSTAQTGWHNETYSVGIHADSAGWIKTYNNASFLTNGNLAATGEVYRSYSDLRLKDISGPIQNALDIVCSWNGVRYTSNSIAKALGDKNDRVQVGLVVQDVKEMAPELVVHAPMDYAMQADGKIISKTGQNYETLIYERAVAYLVEAIKEMRSEVLELRKRVEG